MAVNRSDDEYVGNVWREHKVRVPDETHVDKLASSIKLAGMAWRVIHSRHTAIMGDTTLTDHARLVKSARFAKSALATRRAEFEPAREAAASALKSTHARLQRRMDPPSDPGQAAIFAETRALLRAMPAGERLQVVMASLGTGGDERIAHAALAGPVALSMLPTHHTELTDQYLYIVAGEDMGKALRLGEALEAADHGMRMLDEHAGGLIDFRHAEAIERNADREAA